jgi:hypothetical protein
MAGLVPAIYVFFETSAFADRGPRVKSPRTALKRFAFSLASYLCPSPAWWF